MPVEGGPYMLGILGVQAKTLHHYILQGAHGGENPEISFLLPNIEGFYKGHGPRTVYTLSVADGGTCML